jgi:GNAT superfamily N-acetyltransferase
MSETASPARAWPVRPARPDEQGELSRLCVRATRHLGYDEAFIERTTPSLTIILPHITAGGVMVADDDDGAVAGVVWIMPTFPAFAQLNGIFVEPRFWRMGVGRALFSAAVARARALGVGAIVINAEPSAAGFYERQGAVRIGQIPFFLSPEIDLPILLYLVGAADA